MEHNTKYGRIWLEIFGIGIKWKMRGEAIHLIKVIMN